MQEPALDTAIATQTVAAFLDALAAKQSTPGGGSAAALAAGQGAALLSMVLNFTVGRKRHAQREAVLQEILQRTETLRAAALALADADAQAFRAVMRCYRLPAGSEPEKAARQAALEEALYAAAAVPMQVMQHCRTLMRDAKTIGEWGNRTVLTDVLIGAHLLYAAAVSSETNILINLKAAAPSQRRAAQRATTQALKRDLQALWAEIAEIVNARLTLHA